MCEGIDLTPLPRNQFLEALLILPRVFVKVTTELRRFGIIINSNRKKIPVLLVELLPVARLAWLRSRS